VRFKIRQNFIVEYINSGNRCFSDRELSGSYFAISIDAGLLVNATNTFKISYIKYVLTRVGCFDFSASFIVMFFLF
jgi:hypothetical protein